MPPTDAHYHQYSDEEREALANNRLMRLMAAHGELQAQLTFLMFGFPSIGLAAAHKRPELIQQSLTAVRGDVADVAKAAEKLIAAYGQVLTELATEYRDTLAHEQGGTDGRAKS